MLKQLFLDTLAKIEQILTASQPHVIQTGLTQQKPIEQIMFDLNLSPTQQVEIGIILRDAWA